MTQKPPQLWLLLLTLLMTLTACSESDESVYWFVPGERLAERVRIGDSEASITAMSPDESVQSEDRPAIVYFFNDASGRLSWGVTVCQRDEQVISARAYNVPDNINLRTPEGVTLRSNRTEMFEVLGTPDITQVVERERASETVAYNRHIYLEPLGDAGNNVNLRSFWFPVANPERMFLLRTATTAHACNDPNSNSSSDSNRFELSVLP
jgi:hypothetical protein